MNGELKRCPFCGGQAYEHHDRGLWMVGCPVNGCNASAWVAADSEQKARDEWNTRHSPTPAPGALPELPEPIGHVHSDYEYCADKPFKNDGWPVSVYDEHQMQAYARAYAEQCRAGVWLPASTAPDGDCLEFPIWVAWNNGRVDYVDECACVDYTGCIGWMKVIPPAPPALQSAFADDEGVKL